MVKTRKRKEHPVITKFKYMLATNPDEMKSMNTMMSSLQKRTTLNTFFSNINDVLSKAPEFNKTLLVGTPLSEILIWSMSSPGGFDAYKRNKINDMFREILIEYKKFLDSPASRYVLNDSESGWFGKEASKKINMNEFQCDPTKPYYGFTSWNDFFTRKLKPGVRPIEPTNDAFIHAACDSTLFRIHTSIKSEDTFWIKSQPYSLCEMLGDKKYIDLFTGGSIYQAFLNPFDYHRWHSPVNGTIEKAYVKQGFYFSQAKVMGHDPSAQEKSLGYITHVNTRALIYIKTSFGTICAMFVGMVEISSCNIHANIKPGYKVKKGEELGFFAYGGSTYCLLFEPTSIKFNYRKRVQMGQIIAEIK